MERKKLISQKSKPPKKASMFKLKIVKKGII